MSNQEGYNPLKWKCKERGCYNEKHRFKIEELKEAIPRKMAFGDIDATVEVNGHFLFIEFKGEEAELKVGQKIYFQRLTALSCRIKVIVVRANAETTTVREFKVIANGEVGEWEEIDLAGLKNRIKRWSAAVDARAKKRPTL
jgi:hypothetical protein